MKIKKSIRAVVLAMTMVFLVACGWNNRVGQWQTEAPMMTGSVDVSSSPAKSAKPMPTFHQPDETILVSEDNDGVIRLGMNKNEVITALGDRNIVPITDEYDNLSLTGDNHVYLSFNEEDYLHYIVVAGGETKKGLAPGDSKANMMQIYGTDYLDIGNGPGEDEFVYNMQGYCFMVDFFDHGQPTVTGWKITNMPDFSWDLLYSLYGQTARPDTTQVPADGTKELTDSDSSVWVGKTRLSLGMSRQEVFDLVSIAGLELREDNSSEHYVSSSTEGSVMLYYDDADRVYRIGLSDLVAETDRGLSRGASFETLIELYGNEYTEGVYEEKGITTEYRYDNGAIAITVSFYESSHDRAQNVDVYSFSHHPIYDVSNYHEKQSP